MSRSFSASILLIAIFGLLLCGSTGCSTMGMTTGLTNVVSQTPEIPQEVNGPHYFIEIYPKNGKNQATKVPCVDPRFKVPEGQKANTVQDAMDIARQNGNGVEVIVLRANGQERMNVRFNENGKVRMNYDYVLYPGDHVQILPEDENKGQTPIDRWADNLANQLLPGRGKK